MSNLRKTFAETMVEIANIDKKIVVIVGDISHGLFEEFRNKFPSRYFNIGILESGMVSVASGISKTGLIPIYRTGLLRRIVIEVFDQNIPYLKTIRHSIRISRVLQSLDLV